MRIGTCPRMPFTTRITSTRSGRSATGMKSMTVATPLSVSNSVSSMSVPSRYFRRTCLTSPCGARSQRPFVSSPRSAAKHAPESKRGRHNQSIEPRAIDERRGAQVSDQSIVLDRTAHSNPPVEREPSSGVKIATETGGRSIVAPSTRTPGLDASETCKRFASCAIGMRCGRWREVANHHRLAAVHAYPARCLVELDRIQLESAILEVANASAKSDQLAIPFENLAMLSALALVPIEFGSLERLQCLRIGNLRFLRRRNVRIPLGGLCVQTQQARNPDDR